jgi:SAM-dependent methyltransferase
MYLEIHYKNIKVSYSFFLNGGGVLFAHEFVRIVSQKIGKVGHVFEYCAGPGFIGFSLLANNLCDKLTLADVNPKAIEAIKETIKNNNLQDKVTVYQSDCLDSIPRTERWDLVVGNPPWHLCSKYKKNIIVCDPEGKVHKKFYRDINKFLKPSGSILFIEGGEYTNIINFKGMIEGNGFKIIEPVIRVPFLGIFKDLGEYRGLAFALIIFLRFSLFFRQGYFIWSKKDQGISVKGLNQDLDNGVYSNYSNPELMDAFYSKGEIIQIARKKRLLFWPFFGLLLSYLLRHTLIGTVISPIFSMWAVFAVYQSVMALKKERLVLYVICAVIPVLNLIVMMQLMRESYKVLRINRIREH